MNYLINLGLSIGIEMGFALWCTMLFVVLLIFILLYVPKSRTFLLSLIRSAAKDFEPRSRKLYLLVQNVTSGNQGLPVQLEIFQQNLIVRARMRCRELFNTFKIHR